LWLLKTFLSIEYGSELLRLISFGANENFIIGDMATNVVGIIFGDFLLAALFASALKLVI